MSETGPAGPNAPFDPLAHPEFTPPTGMTPKSLFNVSAKVIGLYWMASGAFYILEMLTTVFAYQIFNDVGVSSILNYPNLYYGMLMTIGGVFVMLKSRLLTDFAFLMDDYRLLAHDPFENAQLAPVPPPENGSAPLREHE